jgi:phosphatidylglycerol---prolipoprotein diacylglyceryl transferase
MAFFHEWIPPRFIVETDVLTLSWYGVLIACAFAIAYGVTAVIWKSKKWKFRHLDWCALVVVGAGVIGARALFVMYHLDYFSVHVSEIPALWHGGWVWHGGFLAGLLALFLYARQTPYSFSSLADTIAPGIALAQAIGRLGNYFNQEAYGYPTDRAWGIPIEPSFRLPGFEYANYFHPTFLYESVISFALFAVLAALTIKRCRGSLKLPDGSLFVLYVFIYSSARFFLEFLRIDTVPLLAGLRSPQWFSIGIMVATLLLLLYYRNRSQSLANK